MYGGHSFQHGGCQWLAREKCWPLHKICDWEGGLLTFPTLASSSTFTLGTITYMMPEKTTSIPTGNQSLSAMVAVIAVIVLSVVGPK
jgi:hypothetical protein